MAGAHCASKIENDYLNSVPNDSTKAKRNRLKQFAGASSARLAAENACSRLESDSFPGVAFARIELFQGRVGDSLEHLLREDTQQLPSDVERLENRAVLGVTLLERERERAFVRQLDFNPSK